jgi:hypothetical protein
MLFPVELTHNPPRRCLPGRSLRPECAMYGRLRIGKENLHVAPLVDAAMCSACRSGSHDRWRIPSADQVPVKRPHSTMQWHEWVVLIVGSP